MWIFEGERKTRTRQGGNRNVLPLPLFVAGFLLAAFALLPSASASPARGLYEVREIKRGVYVLFPEDVVDTDGDPQFNRRTNAGFIVTPEGAAVVDTMNTPFRARDLLYEIRRLTDQPVRYVIDTDAHADVFLGNEVFVAEKSAIIATIPAAAEMRDYSIDLARRLLQDENWRLQTRMRGIHPTPPTQTLDAELHLQLGDEQIRIVPLSGGHSEGDAVVFLPLLKIVFLGHLFENGFFPRIGSSDVHRWIEILKELEAWDAEVYIPAHGPAGGKKELADFRQFLEWLWNEVATRAAEGKTASDLKREMKLTEIYRWSARDLAPRAIEEVYQQVLRERPVTPASADPADQGTITQPTASSHQAP
ncbi:MAG: MBL fold metallo-hydrolase [Acidobacteria bacterium]|nr:MBL fold metallo-hydrolase [Acidobacteriota bacterium]